MHCVIVVCFVVYIRRVSNSLQYRSGDVFSPIPKNSNGISTRESSGTSQRQRTSSTMKTSRLGQRLAISSRMRRFSGIRSHGNLKFGEQTSQSAKLLNDATPGPYEQLNYSSVIQACSGLAYSTFEATSYACILSVEKFLEVSSLHKRIWRY